MKVLSNQYILCINPLLLCTAGKLCLSSVTQEHCIQGKWLQLHGIRELLGLEGNLIISSNSPTSLFPVQESSFKSKYRNKHLLQMTILMPGRELLLIKSKDGSTAPKAILHPQKCLCKHESIQNCVFFLSVSPRTPWNTLCGKGSDTSFL